MPLNAKGFLNDSQRGSHFQAHGADFGAADAQAYEFMAHSVASLSTRLSRHS